MSVPRQGDVTQLCDCWETQGRQLQSLTGHWDLRKTKKKAQLAVFTHPCPVHRHQSAASCELRTAFTASSALLSFRHFAAEKNWAWGLAALSFVTSFSKAISISFNPSSAQYSLNSANPFRLVMGRERKALNFLAGQQGCCLEEREVWGPNLQQLRLELWAQDSTTLWGSLRTF